MIEMDKSFTESFYQSSISRALLQGYRPSLRLSSNEKNAYHYPLAAGAFLNQSLLVRKSTGSILQSTNHSIDNYDYSYHTQQIDVSQS